LQEWKKKLDEKVEIFGENYGFKVFFSLGKQPYNGPR
jgi:hypothetical protein